MQSRFFSRSCRASACARGRGTSAGFTLVELMVAMTGGLFLSVVVFALSRDASRFYQRESRVANATLSGVSGFERLSNDVARAGHLSTPNINADPRLCNLPDAAWPAMLRSLRAILIESDTTPLTGTDVLAAATAGLTPTPQGIVISGALNTSEELYTNQVGPSGGSWRVYINRDTPSAARIGLSPLSTATAANQAVLQSVFMSGPTTGRIIRLRWLGRDQYAVVANVTANPGEAFLTLTGAPVLQQVVAGSGGCGVNSLGKDMGLSVIDLVRYNLRRMVDDPNYAALYKASGAVSGGGPSTAPFENGRAELVRVELDVAGNEIDTTREIVGEYAVDLQFSAWGATTAVNPALVAVDPAAINNTFANTQLLRGLHVRLSMRSREADREAAIVSGSGGATTDIYRFPLTDASGTHYARVRTFQSDVPLRNLENGNW